MKIAFTGLELSEGKTKYSDPVVTTLVEKFDPKKVSPYYFEFMADNFDDAEAIAIAENSVLDLLILDIEKIENRLERSEEEAERELLQRCLVFLEQSQPLCDFEANTEEQGILRALGFLSFKPVVLIDTPGSEVDRVCEAVLKKAEMMFFYTAGKQEVHAWLVEKGADALTCAGKIHSDLARGFIKAELVDLNDLLSVHSFSDARSKGLTQLVDRDHVVEENTVLEIRFNV